MRLLCLAVLLVACDDGGADPLSLEGGPSPDAAADAAPDQGEDVELADAAADVAPDLAVDALADAAVDAAVDLAVDAALDAEPDAAVDAAQDAQLDQAVDARADLGPDQAVDAALDQAVDAEPDQEVDAEPDQEVDADRSPASMEGRVVLPEGLEHLFADTRVTLALPQDLDNPIADTVPDGEGRFGFDALEPGGYILESRTPGFVELAVGVFLDPGQHLAVPPMVPRVDNEGQNSAFVGNAYYGDGPADGHGGIRVEAMGTPFNTLTNIDGEFRLAVPPGVHTVRFSAPGYLTTQIGDAQVQAGEVVMLLDTVLPVAQ